MFRKYMYDIIELNGINRYYTSDEITEDLYLDNDEIKNWELWSYDFEFYRGVKVLSSYEDKLIFTIACLCEACYIQPILKKLDKIGYKYIINYKPLKLDTTVRGVYSDNYRNILSFDKLKFVNKNWCYFETLKLKEIY